MMPDRIARPYIRVRNRGLILREVFEAVLKGEKSRVIAERLRVPLGTVKYYRRAIFRQYGVRSTASLIRVAFQGAGGPSLSPAKNGDERSDQDRIGEAISLVAMAGDLLQGFEGVLPIRDLLNQLHCLHAVACRLKFLEDWENLDDDGRAILRKLGTAVGRK